MSFMKKVAKIAAPFASFIPGVGPLISAGLGMVGSLGGSSSNKKGSTPDPMGQMNSQLMSQLLAGVTQQQGMAKDSFGTGQSLLGKGMGVMDKGMQYHSDILGGKADRALAGPISDLTTGSHRALQNTAMFGARGGATAGLMANRGAQLGGQIARLKTDSLNNSAQSLISGGGAQGQIGASLMGGGMNSYGSTLSQLLGARGQEMQAFLQKQQIDAENKRGLGQGIGSLLGILLGPGGMLSDLFKGDKTSSSRGQSR